LSENFWFSKFTPLEDEIYPGSRTTVLYHSEFVKFRACINWFSLFGKVIKKLRTWRDIEVGLNLIYSYHNLAGV